MISIIIGGLLIVDYFPSFLKSAYLSFRENIGSYSIDDFNYGIQRVEYFDWGISCMNLIIGYLMIINHKQLSNWLSKRAGGNQI